jgi:hypothetical protein
MSGDAAQGLRHGQHAVEFAELAGSAGLRSSAYIGLARAYVLNEQNREALETLTRARTVPEMLDIEKSVEPVSFPIRARAHLGLGELVRAREAADRAVADTRESPTLAVAARLARARVLLATDGANADIETDLGHATKLIEVMAARGLAPFVHEVRATLARLRGDNAGSQRELREAQRLFTAAGATGHAARVAPDLDAERPGTHVIYE